MDIEILYSDEYSQDQLQRLENFCGLAGQETKQAASVNMDSKNWQKNNASLLYLLLIEKRFRKADGGLLCIVQSGKTIAVSGFYRSDFHPDIFVLGVRSWVLKEHRLQLMIAEHLLPEQLRMAEMLGAKATVISFNESTKAFGKLIERSNKNPNSNKKFFFGENYPKLYEDMTFHQKPVFIKNSKQWILIKYLKPFEYDWTQLEINNS